MVSAFHPPSTQHINGAQAQSRNRGHLHRRYEVDDVEGCLPFERRQQTELHRQLAGCLAEHAEEDADLLIARIAVQSAATTNTVLVADDTDLVILLCYYADPDGFDLFMQGSIRGTTKNNRIWDIKSPKVSWVLTSATTSCSYTRYWGVTPHPDYIWSRKRIVAEEIHLQCVVQR